MRRDEDVEVARDQGASLDELEPSVPLCVDLFVLRAAVEADEPPREVVVDGRLRAGRDDEREEREGAVLRAVEEPLADPAAHAALRCRRLILDREPPRGGEQLGKPRLDRRAGVLRGGSAGDRSLRLGNKRPHDRGIEDELGDPIIVPLCSPVAQAA